MENVVNGDVASFLLFGVAGATGWYTGQYWDGNNSLPVLNHGTTGPTHVTDINTNAPHTLNLCFAANLTQSLIGAATAPFTEAIPTILGSFGLTSVFPIMATASAAPPTNIGVEFLYSGPIVNDETAQFTVSPEPTDWIAIGDAIDVGPPVPPTGVWASTEHKDTFSAAGFVPITATWHSTEAKDKTGGTPNQAPYNGIGWLGCVPAFATWHSTDQKDRFSFSGWVIGGGITGRMSTTEARDRMSFSNRTTITGTWGSIEAKDRYASAGFEIPIETPPRPRQRRMLLIT
jgi:hypothetical protein